MLSGRGVNLQSPSSPPSSYNAKNYSVSLIYFHKNYIPNALIGLAISGRTMIERLEVHNRFFGSLKIKI